jgi:2-C-methyl-D-erythritol 4-phosphate cytidylyltransferase
MKSQKETTKYALIVAGGSGSRMGSELPKQFIELAGKPILMHTIEAFLQFDRSINIVLVLPGEQIDHWHRLCQKHHFSIEHTITQGGETRFQSVKNGLSCITEPGLIGVHDGVRPFVSLDTLSRTYELAAQKGNAVPVIDAYESVREATEMKNRALNRSHIKLVQTPQVFHSSVLIEAYQTPFKETFTDDASVVEAAGLTIYLSEGNRENIKLTTPFDLKIARCLLDHSTT